MTNRWSHLDQQLAYFSTSVSHDSPVFGNRELEQYHLASGLANDLERTLRYAQAEWPSILKEVNSPVTLVEKRDTLEGYFHLMQQADFSDGLPANFCYNSIELLKLL